MSGMKIYSSNKMESLFDMLAEVFSTPLPLPFDKEIIVVQNKGIERWVSMELAARFGICGNYFFPFPNRMIRDIFKILIPSVDDEDFINKEYITWKLMDILPHLQTNSEFRSLNNYLKDGPMLKRYQLAERLAEVFDGYTIYRPDMIIDWQEGHDEHWQAHLWNMIVEGREQEHFAALRQLFFDTINTLSSTTDLPNRPVRISVFGISTLPQYHIETLFAASQIMEVHLFFLNPCEQYWADIVPFKVIEKKTRQKRKTKLTPKDLYFEEGNSLLASMGAVGRDFFRALQNVTYEDFSYFIDPGNKTLLTAVQSHILHLTNFDRDHKRVVDINDESIQIHSCHSPMREMEVLYDNLLHIFTQEPLLELRDVVVMTSDIEAYTPFIEAVFGAHEDESKYIPFSIADRGARSTSSVIDTFMMLISLPKGRFGASSIVSLLESEPLLQAFGLTPAHKDLIQRWIQTTEIRWGKDENNRVQYGLPPMKENTWKAGLQRLMLGYAMSTRNDLLFHDISPYEGPEGDEAQVLGSFMEFMEKLFTYTELLEQKLTVSQWAHLLHEILTVFFAPDEESEREIQAVREVIDSLANVSERSYFKEKIDLEVMSSHLNTHLSEDRFGRGFIVGKVTFCTLVPMRSIPFKVICLVGMNDSAFPRVTRSHSFDLMAENPRPSDPAREKEDRYLFLEALISARKYLYISYVGQSVTDNSPFPPSVLVSELIDYLDEGCTLLSGDSIKQKIVKKHRLQAFSPEYFKPESALFSYSHENCTASRFIVNPSFGKPQPFITRGLSKLDNDLFTVDIEQLAYFFSNPAHYFLTRVLGVYLHNSAEPVTEREPFLLSPLENYSLSQFLVEKRLEGLSPASLFKIIKVQGKLPHANVGTSTYERMADRVEFFVQKVKTFDIEERDKPLFIDSERAGFRIIGHIDRLYHNKLIHFRCATVKPKDRLRLWIYHLILCAGYGNLLEKSILIGSDSVWEFLPLKEADRILEQLLEKYRKGLSRPLHFFPDSSWIYAETRLMKKKPHEEALSKAEGKWLGSEYNHGECQDLSYQQCFAHVPSVLDDEFKENSVEIFQPLIEHQREVGR